MIVSIGHSVVTWNVYILGASCQGMYLWIHCLTPFLWWECFKFMLSAILKYVHFHHPQSLCYQYIYGSHSVSLAVPEDLNKGFRLYSCWEPVSFKLTPEYRKPPADQVLHSGLSQEWKNDFCWFSHRFVGLLMTAPLRTFYKFCISPWMSQKAPGWGKKAKLVETMCKEKIWTPLGCSPKAPELKACSLAWSYWKVVEPLGLGVGRDVRSLETYPWRGMWGLGLGLFLFFCLPGLCEWVAPLSCAVSLYGPEKRSQLLMDGTLWSSHL